MCKSQLEWIVDPIMGAGWWFCDREGLHFYGPYNDKDVALSSMNNFRDFYEKD